MNNSRRLSVSAVIGAMGIVYGDIGTSPLYALQSALDAAGGFDAEVVLGVLSLVFWSLAISVTLKYVTVIMRADNEGEGGILALFALAQRRLITGSTWAKVAVALALIGTAFFFCDALITPAISVLGAVEGLEVLNPGLKSGVVPVTIIVIAVLFAYQRRGTARVARLFGPIMLLWFVVIGVIGVIPIVRSPQIRRASALPPGIRRGAALDGDTGDRRRDHRLAGHDLRRLFHGPPGCAPGPAAAAARAADLRPGAEPDLRADRELAGVPGRHRLRGRLWLRRRPGGCVRRRGGRHHGRHHDPGRVRRRHAVELAEMAGGGPVRPDAGHR